MSKTLKRGKVHEMRDLNARALCLRNGDGAHVDKRKRANRQECRKWKRGGEE